MRPLIMSALALLLFGATAYGQGCITGSVYNFSFGGHQYGVVQQKMTYEDASACAQSQGGHLVHIQSQAEQDTVWNAITKGAQVPLNYDTATDGGFIAFVWIGHTDLTVEGDWLWDGNHSGHGPMFWQGTGANGNAIQNRYHNWGGKSKGSNHEPDNSGGQDAAGIALEGWPKGTTAIGIPGEWNDIRTNNDMYWVIEYDCQDSTYYDTVDMCGADSVYAAGAWRTATGTYMDSAFSEGACDSFMVVTVTNTTIDTGVTVNDTLGTITADQSGATYRWLDCANGMAAIAGKTNQTESFIAPSNVAVEITVGDCVDTSACVATASLSATRMHSLELSPNPATNQLSITHREVGNVQLVIRDLAGRVIMTQQMDTRTLAVDVSSWMPGIYVLEAIAANGATSSRRFVVN